MVRGQGIKQVAENVSCTELEIADAESVGTATNAEVGFADQSA